MLVVGCSSSVDLARRIAAHLKKDFTALNTGYFPDGEIHVRFMKSPKGRVVVLVQTLFPANNSLIETLFAAKTARELGAKKIVLVAPYLAYMREDKRFHPGECISAEVMGGIFSRYFDRIITVDPHLHRFKSLSRVFSVPAVRLTAVGLISEYVKKHIKNPLIIGPDEESYQWAETVAKSVPCKATVLKKTRYSGTHVKVHFKGNMDYSGKHVVIVDDMISSGHTMMETIKQVKKLNKKITCIAVHGLFSLNAFVKMKKLGVNIVTTSTISHKSNRIDVAGLIAGALKE
jgi:ribose-phosphate pyrophosphokinase